jgi:hypothetical protein
VPALPSSLLEPVWGESAALLPARSAVDPSHPLGCHRRRVPDRVVFERVLDALVHGSGYERVATAACSDRTLRRRLKEWAGWGVAAALPAICLVAFAQMIGLRLGDISADGVITKAPCGAEKAGPSPVDRREGGLRRSVAAEATGVPLGLVSAGANRHDAPLLAPTLEQARTQVGALPSVVTVHLDGGDDSGVTRALLDALGLTGEIARKGVPAPVPAGKRWTVERLHAWMNNFGTLRRCTDRDGAVVDFYLYLAAALVVVRQLIPRARSLYRWDSRPTTRRLK